MVEDGYLYVDGSLGEGGGQVLRAALALSMALGKPFRMGSIRAKRKRPGLKRQHITCLLAAQRICDAQIEGAELNASEIVFAPGSVKAGNYDFAIGTGGSVSLVLQAILPPLCFASGRSHLVVCGGTHVPGAPPFEFLCATLFPCLELLGPRLETSLERVGYMVVGVGIVHVSITPTAKPQPLLLEWTEVRREARAILYGQIFLMVLLSVKSRFCLKRERSLVLVKSA